MKTIHLFLFSKLIHEGRVSIRDKNPDLNYWEYLQARGLVSISNAGRAGTLIIHSTGKGDAASVNMMHKMEYTDGMKS